MQNSSTHQQLPPFENMIGLLWKLHIQSGKSINNSTDADELRKQMGELWPDLTDHEQAKVDGLSADLYSLVREITSPASFSSEVAALVGFAVRDQNWDIALQLLRDHEGQLPADMVAFFRGRCWDELVSDREISTAFFSLSARINPNDHEIVGTAVVRLLELHRISEAVVIGEQLIRQTNDAWPQLLAAEILFSAVDQGFDTPENVYAIRALAAADSGVCLASSVVNDTNLADFSAYVKMHSAFVQDRLGNRHKAIQSCSGVLLETPTNPDAISLMRWLLDDKTPIREKEENRKALQIQMFQHAMPRIAA